MAKTAKTKNPTEPKQPKSGRVFNIVQYEANPVTGVSLSFTEANIIAGVAHKSISRYAYAKHDEDHYSEIDIEDMWEKYQRKVTLNDKKPVHWHIVLECPNKLTVSRIAKWFGVPENQVEVPNQKGRIPVQSRGVEKVFLECVGYLTHADIRQQALDKHLYPDSVVKANFDWKVECEALRIRREKYGRDLTDKEWYRNEVLQGNIRPRDMMKDLKLSPFYSNDSVMLDKLRIKYLTELAPMPTTRINYYVTGDSGRIGKGLISRAIARSLYRDIKNDDDIFFSIGGEKTTFEDYDGQPVIIWNDIRPGQLIKIFGDRGAMLDSLDIHPVRKREHIKYGKIVLTNEVNIFNSVIPYSEFLDGLAGEYKDAVTGILVRSEIHQKEQAYGRFPIIIPVHADDFDILLNKGFMGEGSFLEYYEHERVVANFRALNERLGKRESVLRKLESKAVQPVIELHKEVKDSAKQVDEFEGLSDDEIMNQFADVGTVISSDGFTPVDSSPFEVEARELWEWVNKEWNDFHKQRCAELGYADVGDYWEHEVKGKKGGTK